MQGWETDSTRTWNIGDDVVAELRNMAERSDADSARIEPVFDPVAFQDTHPEPTLTAFQLTDQQLHDHGILVTQIRQ